MVPDILDGCLSRIQLGQATLEACLVENPADSETLAPLLQTASLTGEHLAPAGPSATYRAHSTKRVLNLVKARLTQPAPPTRRRLLSAWTPAYQLAAVLLALVLLVGSFGVAQASNNSLPGDPLYGVKRGIERAALVVSPSAEGDAEILLRHAERRLAEVEELVRRGRSGDIGPAVAGYQEALQNSLEIGSSKNAVLGDLESALDKHEQVLLAVLEKAPEQAFPALNSALENSRAARDDVERLRQGEHPGDSAPGQAKKTPGPPAAATELPAGQLKKDGAQGDKVSPGQLKKTATAAPD